MFYLMSLNEILILSPFMLDDSIKLLHFKVNVSHHTHTQKKMVYLLKHLIILKYFDCLYLGHIL